MFSRNTDKNPNITHVGPATYVIYSPRDRREEAVPFRFKLGHQFLNESINNPSPTSYTIKYRKRRIKGTAWSKQSQERDCMVPVITRRSTGSFDGVSSLEKLLDFSVPRKFSPSVPPRYKWRSLLAKPIRRKPDFSKKRKRSSLDSPAPGTCNRCNNYKGSHWSKYKEIRFKSRGFILNDHPGPGVYNLSDRQPTPQEQWFEFRRFCKRATAKISRSLETAGSTPGNESLPGPSDTVFTDYIWKKQSHCKKGTFSKAPRKSMIQESDTPSPADYDASVKWLPVIKDQYAPFLSRAKAKDATSQAPGPADYNPPQGTVAFNACKKLPTMFASYVAPFGISALRMAEDDYDSLPGPASYDLTPQEPTSLFEVKKSVPCGRGELFKVRVRAINLGFIVIVV